MRKEKIGRGAGVGGGGEIGRGLEGGGVRGEGDAGGQKYGGKFAS